MRALRLGLPGFALALSFVSTAACTKETPAVAPATIAAVPSASSTARPLAVSSSAPAPESAPRETGPARLVETSGDVPIYSDDPQWGDRKTPALIVFVDLQCPHCAVFHKMLTDATRRPSTRIVWKHFPLRSHPAARPAAEAAQGVFMLAGGDAFAGFVERVFAANAKGAALTAADFVRWAGEVGVRDLEAYRAGLRENRWASTVDRDLALTEKLGLLGTPTLFIDGEIWKGDGNEDLDAAIAKRR